MRDFKKLLIWQKGMTIVDRVYDIIPFLPVEEKYGMRSQITRSAMAIPVNIAEGSAKRSEKDYIRFVEISFGSAFELETHLLIVQKRKWAEDKMIVELLDIVKTEQKMLAKFIEKVGS
jgi:four helix bundle protein